jgi:hypothetical protein
MSAESRSSYQARGRQCSLAGEAPAGGRPWWAHFEFTRINIELTILPQKIEEMMGVMSEVSQGAPARFMSQARILQR